MKDYSSHIAIIGAGISGLTLGCVLKESGVPVIIFEKSSTASEQGAGISISPNGLRVIRNIGIENELRNESGNPKKVQFFYKQNKLTSFPVDIVTTSRQCLYKNLLNKYLSLGGEVLFDHEVSGINLIDPSISFTNGNSFNVNHIAACDGIKSKCRSLIYKDGEQPVYSGYSVWRGILEENQSENHIHLGPNFHIVTYPINNTRTSFVAAIKNPKKQKSHGNLKVHMKTYVATFQNQQDISMNHCKTAMRYINGAYIPKKYLINYLITILLFWEMPHTQWFRS